MVSCSVQMALRLMLFCPLVGQQQVKLPQNRYRRSINTMRRLEIYVVCSYHNLRKIMLYGLAVSEHERREATSGGSSNLSLGVLRTLRQSLPQSRLFRFVERCFHYCSTDATKIRKYLINCHLANKQEKTSRARLNALAASRIN